MLGQKPCGKELPTTVDQRLAITKRAARHIPWRAGGITGIRDLIPKCWRSAPSRRGGTVF